METESKRLFRAGRNERGMALILVLCMLTIMSLLGVLALSTATTELDITANMRGSREAFTAAERAVEYASISGNIYNTIGTATVNLSTAQAGDIQINHAGYSSGIDASETSTDGTKVNQVGYLTSGPLPPSSGSDATLFEMRYYRISVTGHGPNNSSTRIEAQVGRLVPK